VRARLPLQTRGGRAAPLPEPPGFRVIRVVVADDQALFRAGIRVLGITMPVFETGSDPTRIPVAALFAPAAAAMLTALAGVVINVFRRGPGGELARGPG
jgi:hypothetical protein